MSLATANFPNYGDRVYLLEVNALGHAAIVEDQSPSGWPGMHFGGRV